MGESASSSITVHQHVYFLNIISSFGCADVRLNGSAALWLQDARPKFGEDALGDGLNVPQHDLARMQ